MPLSKKIFDYVFAIILLIILAIPMLLIWIIASIDTQQNGIFTQKRVGQNAKLFTIYKFRSLKGTYTNSVTTEKSHKITHFGRFLIKTKLDETPQLINILNGTMSFVGPRPDVQGYADVLKGEDRIILKVKPGITGPAQLAYKNENEILNQVSDPIKYNDEVLWSDKVKINKKYVKNWNFKNDILYLLKTIGFPCSI
ncbi:sugar transferase [Ornithobacterium rhinotracheale]|uniref:Glycosyl transferase possibly involved in lipopolysaccharide synthesis n=1 Tax=Ornithobacterium rhinotracheale (strain ATCC 51463 / DSM 15997 / CCUG 23171 / CIP 104009 / LMG 9086) TaxID=867902 RepID=I3ZX82_ORNRL|nr:sugar transferase [Ornithobacterium rhinotracheale]AFL96316.1 glycosyl transferase possibly involved in lipopolysaccharide synthesis [Ornithobacterium rhinotracheale DSM 15997]AIP98556.1 sugar transferase [Ornithobacterium rhinotracheale ORT-UMN 88]KGB67577.1 sugar transferase [Ornithobacterium rhinotracheale H06-030791]MBN3662070.1 sugar transferase [Ornithobacterium rhinotracheale]UVD87372.1 sugar transferase [Ornithobacterium rhinotracheale]